MDKEIMICEEQGVPSNTKQCYSCEYLEGDKGKQIF